MITANTWFKLKWEEWKRGRLDKQAARFQISLREPDSQEEPIPAHISEGAWLVHCPEKDCRGVEYAWEEGFFVCCSCLNSKVGHKIRRSAFPAERKEIEALLEVRPLLNRNWYPGETLDDLRRENEEHKDELLTAVNSSEGG